MEAIEDIGQRIYDIQGCLAYIVNGGTYDDETILALNTKMTRLERALSDIEERIDTQLSYLQEIPDLIAEVKEFHSMCQEIPSPGPNESAAVFLPVKKKSNRVTTGNEDRERKTVERKSSLPRRQANNITPS